VGEFGVADFGTRERRRCEPRDRKQVTG